MKRLLPDSIAALVLVVLVAGLVTAQAVTLAIHYRTRATTATVFENFRVAERMADLVRLVDVTPASQRARIVDSVKSGTLRAAWGGRQAPLGAETNDAGAQLFADVLQAALWDVPWQRMRVYFTPAASGPVTAAPGGRPSDRSTSLGRSIDSILVQHARVPVLRVAIQLQDSSWLNLEAPFVEAPGLYSRRSMVLLTLAALSIVLLSFWAVRRLTAPLVTLARAADRLGSNVNTPPLPESGARELRQAARAFNLMQGRLQKFVQDRVQMTAAISHDLRTPITRLRLRAEWIEDDEQRRKTLADLDEMESMIDATLAFAREESNNEPLADVDLVSLVDDVCADRPDVTFETTPTASPRVVVHCRPLAMRRCLGNLVDNAVKYGERARVLLDASPSSVCIRIDDDGPGIPESDQARMFLPYERLDVSRNSELGGVGLGLAIARTIARSHGGDVRLANRPGGGLRVEVELPR